MISKQLIAGVWHDRQRVHVSQALVDSASADVVEVCRRLETRPEGLTDAEAARRLGEHGPNVLAKDTRAGILTLIRHAVLNPLVILLALLASISFATGDTRAGTMMAAMISLGAGLKLVQEARADSAAAKLKHVVAEDLPIADVKKIKDAKTVGGAKVDVTYNLLTGVHIGTAKEMAHVQNSDIHATHGVIHVVDKGILP